MNLTTDDIRLLLFATNKIIGHEEERLYYLKKWKKEEFTNHCWDTSIEESKKRISSFKKLNKKLIRGGYETNNQREEDNS